MFQLSTSYLKAGARIGSILLSSVRNYKMDLSSSSLKPSATNKLREFGYDFNEKGVLKQLDKKTGELTDESFDFNISKSNNENQEHYDKIGEVITDYVYELLEKNGMHKIYFPPERSQNEAFFIYASKPNLQKSKKLLILIHGSGVVRAGQWARSLIINQSIDHGTQLPYIKKAQELGYDVIVTNTNDNTRTIHKDGKPDEDIQGSPSSHAAYVWKRYVVGSDPESVAIVAHSYGGQVTIDLADKNPEFFKEKVFAIGLTDSAHMIYNKNPQIVTYLQNIGRNWVTSNKPLNELVKESKSDFPRYSAAHARHEWTSYTSMSAVFEFLEKKYEEFLKNKE